MIIIHVMGGLGNQLYQYALYEKFKLLGKEVKLDLYAYKGTEGEEREWRALELEWLDGLEYEVCTEEERRLFLDNGMKFTDRVRRKLIGRREKQSKKMLIICLKFFQWIMYIFMAFGIASDIIRISYQNCRRKLSFLQV